MLKWYSFLLISTCILVVVRSQETTLPVDLRQHNLTEFNSSLFNPVFSLDRNRPQSIALWSRWQWQNIDADPTTLFLNYTRKINTNSALGVGFFQNNSELFLNTGGVINYAYSFDLGNNSQLAVGLNVFGYKQKFTSVIVQPDPPLPLPQLDVDNPFILQFAPGIRLTYNGLGIGLASENLFDYNFATKEGHTLASEKIYIGSLSYDIPVASIEALIQPNVYLKTIPNGDTQYGLTALLTASKFWAQSGYNSFYGIGLGGGGRFFQKVSLGALVEFGTSSLLKNSDPSFEVLAAYNFGPQDLRKKVVAFEDSEELETAKERRLKEKLAQTEALAKEKETKKQLELAEKERNAILKDSLDTAKRNQELATSEKVREQRRLDSLAETKAAEALALEQKRQDSIAKTALAEAEAAAKKAELDKQLADKKTEQPKTQGRYEEVTKEDGVVPGYYLVANVFGTKKYFDNFMNTLRTKGLNPKSFYRSVNKYNYVYLERYDTLKEAEVARDNQFNGKYTDKTWIFRVIGD